MLQTVQTEGFECVKKQVEADIHAPKSKVGNFSNLRMKANLPDKEKIQIVKVD